MAKFKPIIAAAASRGFLAAAWLSCQHYEQSIWKARRLGVNQGLDLDFRSSRKESVSMVVKKT